MTPHSLLLSWIACAPMLAACSYEADIARANAPQPDAGPPSSAPSNPGDSGAPNPPHDGGGTSDTGDAFAASDAGTSNGVGLIGLTVTSAQGPASTVTAAFTATPPVDSPSCTERVEGACTIQVCPSTAMVVPQPYMNAGSISVSNFMTLTQANTDPLEPGVYFFEEQGSAWSAGQPVNVQWTGGDVPASAVSIDSFPSALNVTNPTSLTTISKSAGVSLSWQETFDAVGILFLQNPGGSGNDVNISCAIGAPSSGYTLTPAMLTDLTIGTTGVNTLQVESQYTVIIPASELVNADGGRYQVAVQASVGPGATFMPADITP
jgi:hypothetical protein